MLGFKLLLNCILFFVVFVEGMIKVENLLDSDDIRYMVDVFKVLGLFFMEDRENNILEIIGCGGKFLVEGVELFFGNVGTAM